MPVKIRLTRMGRPRDGAYIEQIGRYDPRAEPSLVEIDNERALDWLQKGAQPTERAKKLLEISGAWTRFAIDRGDIHTVGTSESAATPEAAPADAAPLDEVATAAEETAVEEVVAATEEAVVEEVVAATEEAVVEEAATEEAPAADAEAVAEKVDD